MGTIASICVPHALTQGSNAYTTVEINMFPKISKLRLQLSLITSSNYHKKYYSLQHCNPAQIVNDLTIGWQILNPLSHPNATLASQARQARASVENLNYMTLAPQALF